MPRGIGGADAALLRGGDEYVARAELSPSSTASATGASGARGEPGQIRLVTCKTVTRTVTKNGKKHKVSQQKCTRKLITGTATLTTTLARARVTRDGKLYATGTANLTGLVLHDLRPLRPGSYTLTLIRRQGPVRITTRQPITIG